MLQIPNSTLRELQSVQKALRTIPNPSIRMANAIRILTKVIGKLSNQLSK